MAPRFLKVRDKPELSRDPRSNAILNTDIEALNKYKQERDEKMKLARVEERQEKLEADISEIKNLLKELLGKR